MFILFLLATIIFLYIAIFTVYYLLVVLFSVFDIKKKPRKDIVKEYKNLLVIIYSHNNEKTIVNLLEQLNKQDYPKGNYQTHIILDNCSDNSSNKLEFVGGAKLWRLTDDVPMGRDKAISWLLENLLSFKKVDAYVFLNANRVVQNDFLYKINEALQENAVVVGSTEIFLEDADYYEKVWSNVNQYNSAVMRKGRANLGLAVSIDSDIIVIKHEVLEKIQCIDFRDANSELKYSFLLTSVNYPPKFVPEIKTFVSSVDYELRRPTFAHKMSLFLHCFNFKSLMNLRFAEFLFSMLKPNPIILSLLVVAIGIYSSKFFFVDVIWSVVLALVLALSFGFSVYKTHLYVEPLLYLASCPFYTLSELVCENKFFKKIFKFEKKKKVSNIETITVPVNVTNGRNVFPCQLELVSDGGFKKAIFKYKNKKQETAQSYVRMCDAVKNISDTLEQHGFRLKICQACAYFSPKIDGTNNMVKGYCNKHAVDNQECTEVPETLLWSTCEYYIPQEVNKVIDISNYIKNR